MTLLLYLVLLASHLAAAAPFVRSVSRSRVPSVVDFACMGLVVYMDLGLCFELLGARYSDPHFAAFGDAPPGLLARTSLLLFFAPWLLRLGAGQLGARVDPEQAALPPLRPWLRLLFYALALTVCAAAAAYGISLVRRFGSIWVARAYVAETLRTNIILLYFPMHFLAFYVRHADSRTLPGRLFCALLVLASVASTLPVGQRTNTLLPLLIVVLFSSARLSMRRLMLLGASGILLASALLPLFKWQAQEDKDGLLSSVVGTVYSDYHRANVLADVVRVSGITGASFMPYPGAGYVYGALFFVPRDVAPFKGQSTQTYLTASKTGESPEMLGWGRACGLLEELVANVGLPLTFPGLLLCGALMRALDRASRRRPAMVVPTRLGVVWLMGYGLVPVLLTFGVMFLLCWALALLFSTRAAAEEPAPEGEASGA